MKLITTFTHVIVAGLESWKQYSSVAFTDVTQLVRLADVAVTAEERIGAVPPPVTSVYPAKPAVPVYEPKTTERTAKVADPD